VNWFGKMKMKWSHLILEQTKSSDDIIVKGGEKAEPAKMRPVLVTVSDYLEILAKGK
jgi:hypothetical protein